MRGNLYKKPETDVVKRSIPACAGEPYRVAACGVRRAVYPRVCGGTSLCTLRYTHCLGLSPRVRGNLPRGVRRACAVYRPGLSPRVRGNHVVAFPAACGVRSIPACAGEPERRRPDSVRATVYPRVCGGTDWSRRGRRSRRGLSPRVRGNPGGTSKRDAAWRSIPACAGEPTLSLGSHTATTVYPRVCGGTSISRRYKSSPYGLSPRVRGNPSDFRESKRQRGSIPACAGEPDEEAQRGAGLPVYPRVCGGTLDSSDEDAPAMGLSPRVRGNLPDLAPSVSYIGSIPACAGEPKEKRGQSAGVKVYPRVCGGTRRKLPTAWTNTGLSPRVRGNLLCGDVAGTPNRSIPACAGEPGRRVDRSRPLEVYPRVCGGTISGFARCRLAVGLSPRVRGNLDEPAAARLELGSIPACAGEPSNVTQA